MRLASATRDALGEIRKIPTPKDPKEAIETFVREAQSLANGEEIAAIAGGIRWVVSDGVFLPGDKALPEWGGLRLIEELQNSLHAPVSIVHDTGAVGLGEAHVGAGKGSRICAYVTVSTGVGGDRIVDGVIDRATYNPEIGKQLVNGIPWEDLISGTAVQKKFGISPKDLESVEERNALADILAIGLFNTSLHWSPDTIVLGGSMIVGVNPIPLDRTRDSLARLLTLYPTPPAVVMAKLGDNGGLEGGRVLASRMV
jgi:glucokinase